MYEHRKSPLLPRRTFLRRLGRHALLVTLLIGVSLVMGTVGYRVFAGFAWIDAFLNASMLLGGMGPVGDIPTESGKLFASFYALYAGLVFIASAGVLLAPVLHRLMHSLHLESKARGDA